MVNPATVNVTQTYTIYSKHNLAFLKKQRLIGEFRPQARQTIMYVRAPKHFKRGKQKILLFRYRYLVNKIITLKNANLNLFLSPQENSFTTLASQLLPLTNSSCIWHRTTAVYCVKLKLNDWCYLYANYN